MSFLTEKQTEAWLEPEARLISMPCGTIRPFTMEKVVWTAHDYVVAWGNFTPQRIVELALIDGREKNRPFEMSYPHTIGYINNAYRNRFGNTTPWVD